MSSKKSRRTVIYQILQLPPPNLDRILFMPYSEALLILPRIISPLNGRKTMSRNSTVYTLDYEFGLLKFTNAMETPAYRSH